MTVKMRFPKPTPQLKKILVIILAVCAVVMLVLLAASLQNLEFKSAQVFFLRDENRSSNPCGLAELIDSAKTMTAGDLILLIGGFLVLFILGFVLLSPRARKRLIYMLLQLGLTLWAVLWLVEHFRKENIAPTIEGGALQQVTAAPPIYTPPNLPGWVTYIVSFLILLIIGAIAYFLWRFFRPVKQPLRVLATVARSSLKDLSRGRDWDDIVIQCYARMSEAVDQNRGLRRQQAMTPHEFAGRMERAGLPFDPVRRLTRLFEKARYGERKSSREDVNEAVSCLTAILHAVGEQP